MYPEVEWRVPELYGDVERLVEGYEYRYLKDHGQAAAQRGYLVSLGELHQFLVHLLLVVLLLFFQCRHLRLHLLHLAHRIEALFRERVEEDLYYYGKDHYREAVVSEVSLEEVQYHEEGPRKPVEPAELNGVIAAGLLFQEPVILLWAHE